MKNHEEAYKIWVSMFGKYTADKLMEKIKEREI